MQVLSLLNKIIPKDSTKILFYDSGRSTLEDNAEAIYSWLKNNGFGEKYKLIVCVPNENGKNIILDYCAVGAVRGIYEFLTSRYVFYSFGDFRIRPSKNQIVVNLWHGSPLRKLGKMSNDEYLLKERIDNFTYVLAASDLFVPIMAKAFGCSVNNVKVLGHPRNDYLFSSKESLKLLNINRNLFCKLVLWMPTFRQSKDNRFIDSDNVNTETLLPLLDTYKKLREFDMKLQELNILVVIKIHPYAKFKDIKLKNIVLMQNEDILSKGVKLYEFVKEFDALITDYSSIYYDFMLLDKPIGFTVDDYESIRYKRGFVFEDIFSLMPGKHINNETELMDFVLDIKNNLDEFKYERNTLLPILSKYVDCDNCRRLAEDLGIVSDEEIKFNRN